MVAILSAILNGFTNPQQRNNLQTKTRQKERGRGGGWVGRGGGANHDLRYRLGYSLSVRSTLNYLNTYQSRISHTKGEYLVENDSI